MIYLSIDHGSDQKDSVEQKQFMKIFWHLHECSREVRRYNSDHKDNEPDSWFFIIDSNPNCLVMVRTGDTLSIRAQSELAYAKERGVTVFEIPISSKDLKRELSSVMDYMKPSIEAEKIYVCGHTLRTRHGYIKLINDKIDISMLLTTTPTSIVTDELRQQYRAAIDYIIRKFPQESSIDFLCNVCDYGCFPLAKDLIDAGINVNGSLHRSPFLTAISCGSYPIANYLLDKGLSPEIPAVDAVRLDDFNAIYDNKVEAVSTAVKCTITIAWKNQQARKKFEESLSSSSSKSENRL